jgi:hypothetical protein
MLKCNKNLIHEFHACCNKTADVEYVVALRYKSGGRGFETRRGELICSIDQSFRPHWALGFTQLLTEMSTRGRKIMFLGSRARPVRRADNLTAICEPIV